MEKSRNELCTDRFDFTFSLCSSDSTEIWLIYMTHRFTEEAESFLPKSTFVEANRAAYSQAGFIGKGMRNGFLTLVLMIPGLCAKRGVVDIAEAKNFPKDLKRILFVSWGSCFVFLSH
ncbi:hypothetical protein [Pseudomonas silesiensis]|uniref:hypothetical protein n=1 Tax=Pseudomonas silesiensis TaxID=1853130 RepID=UPI0030D99E2C